MKNDEIRQANKKALPKFFLLIIVGAIIGGVLGIIFVFAEVTGDKDKLVDFIKDASRFFGAYIVPWVMLAVAFIFPAVGLPIYNSAKKQLATWDGEDDVVSSAIDRKLSIALWVSSIVLILSFFLLAASFYGINSVSDGAKGSGLFSIGFLITMIEEVLLQQKCVDAAKQMNPEKKASFYDVRFLKKWNDDCDEAEKIINGKCAYKAFSVTNIVCTFLSGILAVCASLPGVGFLPSLTVCFVWMINTSVYYKEAIRYSKAGNKIS